MSLLKDIWSAVSGIGKGMEKTYDEQFDPVFTEMYPFVQPQLPPVSVQSLALIKNEDGSDRCVSCLACEKVCPSQVITIERKRNPAGKGFVLERFDLDLVNCMYCAACVESCPAQAIVTIQDFEMCTPNLQALKADKDFLDYQGLRARQWYSPKVGVEYREEDPENPIHGKIVKAPIEEQPGGLQEMEKARLAALEPPKPVIEQPGAEASKVETAAPAPMPVVEKPVAEPLPAPAPTASVSNEDPAGAPTNPERVAEAPKAQAVISSPAPEPPMADVAPAVATPQAAPSSPPPVAEPPKPEALASRPAPEAPKSDAAPAVESPEAAPSSADSAARDGQPETPPVAVPSRMPEASPATPKLDATKRDDLVIIEGIGPKRAEALVAAGITSFAQLAQTEQAKLEEIMKAAGLSLEPGLETWPVQAELLARGDMAGFDALTVRLVAGRLKDDQPKNAKIKRWEPKKPGDG